MSEHILLRAAAKLDEGDLIAPPLAAPLAAWLRNTDDWMFSGEPCPYAEAEQLARAILGEEQS